MRKTIAIPLIFALLLSIFSCAAARDINSLPPIDRNEASAYLGVWYLDEMCDESMCMSPGDFGMEGELAVNTDNTLIFSISGSEETPAYWYIEDGTAYFMTLSDDEYLEQELLIEDGRLIMAAEGMGMYFVRDKGITFGTGEIVEDASLDMFSGTWYSHSVLGGEMNMPLSLFGFQGVLMIYTNGTLNISFGDETAAGVPFEYKDGKISSDIPDAGGGSIPVLLVYHAEEAVVLTTHSQSGTEVKISFVREENRPDISLDALSGAFTND
ncbi:MAG: hypothetical protein IJI14_08160 [Anaerolineaceae bacterium]|nr:hypothetical protein [Anaerolineaceae bacterium]